MPSHAVAGRSGPPSKPPAILLERICKHRAHICSKSEAETRKGLSRPRRAAPQVASVAKRSLPTAAATSLRPTEVFNKQCWEQNAFQGPGVMVSVVP